MVEKGITSYTKVVASDHEDTTPLNGQMAYYAVVNGRNPGIQSYYKYDLIPFQI